MQHTHRISIFDTPTATNTRQSPLITNTKIHISLGGACDFECHLVPRQLVEYKTGTISPYLLLSRREPTTWAGYCSILWPAITSTLLLQIYSYDDTRLFQIPVGWTTCSPLLLEVSDISYITLYWFTAHARRPVFLIVRYTDDLDLFSLLFFNDVVSDGTASQWMTNLWVCCRCHP